MGPWVWTWGREALCWLGSQPQSGVPPKRNKFAGHGSTANAQRKPSGTSQSSLEHSPPLRVNCQLTVMASKSSLAYVVRSKQHPNALARRLFKIAETKKTNVVLSGDLTKTEDLLKIADGKEHALPICQRLLESSSYRLGNYESDDLKAGATLRGGDHETTKDL